MEELFGAWNNAEIKIFKGLFSDYQAEHHTKMFAEILSKEEREQLALISEPTIRKHFSIRRGMLRIMLSKACKTPPKDLQIKIDSFGKPYLLNTKCNFNISSSGNIFLIAYSKTANVGIDIEQIDRTFDYAPLIEDYFSLHEQEFLKLKLNHAFFFKAWTLKEACAKALGTGVAQNLKAFDSAYVEFAIEDSHLQVMQVLNNREEIAVLAYR